MKKADKDCKMCHGTGIIIDWVPRPFGPGDVRMETGCDCIYEECTRCGTPIGELNMCPKAFGVPCSPPAD